MEVLADLGEERMSRRRWWNFAGEEVAEADGASVEGLDGIHVGADVGSVEGCSGEDTFSAGVGEDSGVGLPVRVGADFTAKGASGDSGIGTNLPVGGDRSLCPGTRQQDRPCNGRTNTRRGRLAQEWEERNEWRSKSF